MGQTRSSEERVLGLGHMKYEVGMMVEAAKRLQDVKDEPGFVRNVLVEVTLVHARNLIEFLGDRNKKKNEMSPDDFVPGWEFGSCKELMGQLGPINENLTHLSWKRVSGGSSAVGDELVEKVLDACDGFRAHLASSGWLGEQPMREALSARPARPLQLGLVNGTN